MLCVFAGCHHFPASQMAPQPLPLPAKLAEKLRPSSESNGTLEIELLEEASEVRRYRFELIGEDTEADPIRGEFFQLVTATADSPGPLVQISPILGGAINDYLLTRIITSWAVEAGFSCFFVYQDEEILDPELDASGIEDLIARTTRENIQAIDVFASRPEIDEKRLGCFGISLGAIKNVLLLAAEPRLRGGIFCLSGGNLPRIFELSREPLVEEYLEKRSKLTGLRREEILADLGDNLGLDPLDVAPFVGADRAIVFLGSLDDKVPYATGLRLYHSLGKPELYVLPIGHYTGMVAAPWVADLGFEWLLGKMTNDPLRISDFGFRVSD